MYLPYIWFDPTEILSNVDLKDFISYRLVMAEPSLQDRSIVSLLSPDRLLKLTKYFTLYDANVKKICRYQQFFAVEEIIKTNPEYSYVHFVKSNPLIESNPVFGARSPFALTGTRL